MTDKSHTENGQKSSNECNSAVFLYSTVYNRPGPRKNDDVPKKNGPLQRENIGPCVHLDLMNLHMQLKTRSRHCCSHDCRFSLIAHKIL